MEPIQENEESWKEKLSPEQYRILREKGTEAPFTGKYYESKEDGMYHCAACGNVLFSSDAKFDSGTGWPSFYKPAYEGSVKEQPDDSMGMHRTEIICGKCGSHLGHVFQDGPAPTGLRYCINSCSLDLNTEEKPS